MKNIFFYFLLALSLIYCNAYAQLGAGGVPPSVKMKTMIPDTRVPFFNMPSFDVGALLKEDSSSQEVRPLRFGHTMELNKGLRNSGMWQQLDNGDRIWRIGIRSNGAFSMNLVFNEFHIPYGAELFIYNSNKSKILGAFTEANNTDDGYFGTMPIPGDEIIVEYYEPVISKDQGKLKISQVVHGYKNVFYEMRKAYGLGNSFPCQRNVNCPEGLDWQDQSGSVAMIVAGGALCTGAMINNTSEDGRPYFLTASHCLNDYGPHNNVGSWVFLFNFESFTEDCSNPDPGTINIENTISGSRLVSRNVYSDMMLLELHNQPPAEYNVFYAGWSRQNAPATSTAGIHHPHGDIKKISLTNYGPTSSQIYGSAPNSMWYIARTNATMQSGSSGSPLFDQNKRIVGQLWGGSQECASSRSYYGKISYSWDTAPEPHRRLKEWLDPQNTGLEYIDGEKFTPVSIYCHSGARSFRDTRIDHVAFGMINNTSNTYCGVYGRHTNLYTELAPNQVQDFSVTLGTCNESEESYVKIFIDWNGDGDFSDPGEMVAVSEVMLPGETFYGSITVPSDITTDITTRMRIVCHQTSDVDDVQACGYFANGETEDYSIRTLPPSAPRIVSFSPESGSPGTIVEITGTGFLLTSHVLVNGINTTFETVSSNLIRVTIPNGASTGPFVVINPNGYSASEEDFIVDPLYCNSGADHLDDTKIQRVRIGSIDNNTDPDECETYQDFTNLYADLYDDVNFMELIVTTGQCDGVYFPRKVKVYVDWDADGIFSEEELMAVSDEMDGENEYEFSTSISAPEEAAWGSRVRMRIICWETDMNADVDACSDYSHGETQDYMIRLLRNLDPPHITGFAPNTGYQGVNVTIRGTNFIDVSSVKFNDVAAVFVVQSPTSIVATVPADASTGKISVTTPGGTVVSFGDFQIYRPEPVIYSFSPVSGEPGSTVIITGEGFINVWNVLFHGSENTANNVSYSSYNTIVATVPHDATTGVLTIVMQDTEISTDSDFTIGEEGEYTPVIIDADPRTGEPGDIVIITGSNLMNVSSVKFNGTDAFFVYESSSRIVAMVPYDATTGPISVVTSETTVESLFDFVIETNEPWPNNISIAPAHGQVGSRIVVSGEYFGNVSTVHINGIPVIIHNISENEIQIEIPEGASSGLVTIITASGIVVETPLIFTVDPTTSVLTSESTKIESYPNPFSETITFRIMLPGSTKLKLEILDIFGTVQKVVVDGQVSEGIHEYEFSGTNLTAGTYLYRLTGEDILLVKKMIKY
ncbi:MAG: IPT/TIG domain-containing protein [Cytophagaceae bacterium]